MNKSYIIFLILLFPATLIAQSITNTKHNLSVSGPSSIHAESESEICIFCHTPHSSSPRNPLWNKNDPGFNYTLYNSSTLQASSGQPDGSSILCLSCHDGTIALGSVISRDSDIGFVSGITTLPSGSTNLSTNLADDHPISFIYNTALATADGELTDPLTLTGQVHLENSKVQCISCHEPHNSLFDNFLVASTQFSDLCLFCHQKNNWDIGSHKTSNAGWNGNGNDPWIYSTYSSVSENACANCHNVHTANRFERLMNFPEEENNCLNCHNGNVASTDIQSMLNNFYKHDVASYLNIHDPVENSVVNIRHVECEDCHNPHESRNMIADAPNANGFIAGVKGVNTNGIAVSLIEFEYELCYRCHADSPDKPGSPTFRQIEQNNVRLEFDVSNPSFHPIEGPGKNSNVPSLISPLTESSSIYCTDCHASDGPGSPAGPHGSIYPNILKYNYIKFGRPPESFTTYELCYQCHDRNVIINTETSFGKDVHKKHIVDKSIPCNRCHDPHGISASQGNETNNTHLINFDITVAQPGSGSGRLEFVDQGDFQGECYVRCHGKNHDSESY